MYYSLISHQAKFTKNQPQLTSQRQPSRLERILPLANNQVILFYDNRSLYHVQVKEMNVLHHLVLEGNVYDAIAISNQRVIVMVKENKSIVEINLLTKELREIYKIAPNSIYSLKKQLSHFFLSKLHSFSESNSFYLQQNLSDQRIVKIIYFPNTSSASTLNEKDKHTFNTSIINLNEKDQAIKFQVRQFEAKNHLFLRLDQYNSIVRFAQNPLENGRFSFQEINLQTMEIIDQKLEWPSFVLYSTVIDIKKFHQEKYLICVNSKNSSHQAIVYNYKQKTIHTLCQSDKIFKQCIFVNEKLNLCMFSFLYGQVMDSQILTLVDLTKGKLVYQREEKVDRLVVGKDMQFMVQYRAQFKGKDQSLFRVFSLANKTCHYLKMMENLKLDSLFGQEFVNTVAQMLKD